MEPRQDQVIKTFVLYNLSNFILATPSDEHVLPKSRLPSSEPKKQKSKYAPLFYIVRVIRTGVKHLYMSSSVVKNTGLLL